jgi:hypothetical protein
VEEAPGSAANVDFSGYLAFLLKRVEGITLRL